MDNTVRAWGCTTFSVPPVFSMEKSAQIGSRVLVRGWYGKAFEASPSYYVPTAKDL